MTFLRALSINEVIEQNLTEMFCQQIFFLEDREHVKNGCRSGEPSTWKTNEKYGIYEGSCEMRLSSNSKDDEWPVKFE